MAVEPSGRAQNHRAHDETTNPKFDVLNRDKLPSLKDLGIEIRQPVESEKEAFFLTASRTVSMLVLVIVLVASAHIVSATIGPWLSSNQMIPVWVGAALVWALVRFMKGAHQ